MDWKIINHRQFEEIACKYAQDIHKEFTWIPTKKTHDGNKDGEFESEIRSLNIIYKGWYEAKYTQDSENSIDKSHMDSTLVSGILDGSVVYILFITNGRIIRDFRRRAKAILTPYKINVDFVEGDILEEWLGQRPDVNNFYFNDSGNQDNINEAKIEVDDLCFFDALMNPATLISPIQNLIVENEYYLYISIRSNIRTFIDIYICNDCLIQIPEKNNEQALQINPGFNSFFIKCYAKYPFKGEFKLNINFEHKPITHKILSNFNIENDYEPHILYGKQTKIIHEIYNYTVLETLPSSILSVKGKAGTGKSHLLRALLRSIADKNHDILVLQLSDKIAENACSLCKLILFLNFGNLYTLSEEAFLELIKNSINLPFNLYSDLREGTQNQIAALAAINKISEIIHDSNYSLLLNTNFHWRRNISYIIIDDLHKLSPSYSIFYKLLLNEFSKKSHAQIMILGYRPNEFKDTTLELIIDENQNKSWQLDSLSNNDIDSSIEKNLNKYIVEIAQLFPKPINILHLSLLIRKLIEKSIVDIPPDLQILNFSNCYKETNIQNSQFVKNKIQNCKYKELLFLIYKIESGITIDMLESFYGVICTDKIKYLTDENYIKHENQLLKPFHDVYLYAFHDIEIYDQFNNVLQDFLEFCISNTIEQPEIESNILALFLTTSQTLPHNVIESIKKSCLSYYQTSKYTAAKILSQALLPDLDDTALMDYSKEDIQMLYIYAMSIKYSQTHEGSNKYLSLICNIGKVKFLDSNYIGYVYEAYSELLNNAIWLMNKQDSLKYITYLENLFTSAVTTKDSVNKVNAYLNLLNRKILYSGIFLNSENFEELFQQALSESKRLNRNDYIGYAMMDKAKSTLSFDMASALSLLKKAYEIFQTSEAYLKRKYDCQAEIIFLEHLLYNSSFDQLYQIQHEAYINGLLHAYAKTTLKILALELSHNFDIESIELRLKQLFIQYPDMKNKQRLNSFSYLLWSGIYYKRKNYSKQYQYAKKHLTGFKDMSVDYRDIAQHNCQNLSGQDILWYSPNSYMDKNCFWLDMRLW